MTEFQVTFDCADPDRMARFWALALDYRLQDPPEGFDDWYAYYRSIGVPEDELQGDPGYDRIYDPTGAGPKFWFQPVPEGKVAKNRLHLDLKVSGGREVPIEVRQQRVDAMVERLVAAGARRVQVDRGGDVEHYFVLMNDPEGNEFCVA